MKEEGSIKQKSNIIEDSLSSSIKNTSFSIQDNNSNILEVKNSEKKYKHNIGNNLNDNENDNIDEIQLIDKYLNRTSDKLSKHQYKIIIITGFVLLVDGIHMTLLSSMLIPIKSAFDISEFSISLISSMLFLVVGISSYFSSHKVITDNKISYFNTSFLLLSISTLMMGIVFNLSFFILCRLIQGLCIGMLMPLSISLLCEIMPINKRASVMILTSATYLLGACLNSFLCILILPENLYGGNLYAVFILLSMLTFVCYYYCKKNIRDSPRSLIINNRNDEAFEILELVINNSDDTGYNKENTIKIINDKDKSIIIEEIIKANSSHKEELSTLFNNRFKDLTVYLTGLSLVNSFILYGCTFILAVTLKEIKLKYGIISSESENLNSYISNSTFRNVTETSSIIGNYSSNSLNENIPETQNSNSILYEQMFVYIITLPSIFIASYLCNHKKVGRKLTMLLGYASTSIIIMIGFCVLKYFFTFFGIAGFFLTLAFQASSTYSVEVYPTKIRRLSIGFLSLTTRIAGFLSQPISVILFNINYLGQFYFGLLLGVIGVYCSWKLPFDTLGKSLDQIRNKKIKINVIKFASDDFRLPGQSIKNNELTEDY